LTKRPMPKIYVTRFFQLTTTRQFTEAERILQRLKQKMHISEYNRGYYQALNGILLAQKNNDDRYAFLPNLNPNNKKELHNQRREFLKQSQFHLHADYDKGFFAAWTDYMNILTKIELPTTPSPAPNASQVKKQKTEETEIEKETETEAEAKTETIKETTDQKREKLQEESKKEEITELKETEKIEPRQSTLFDFSK